MIYWNADGTIKWSKYLQSSDTFGMTAFQDCRFQRGGTNIAAITTDRAAIVIINSNTGAKQNTIISDQITQVDRIASGLQYDHSNNLAFTYVDSDKRIIIIRINTQTLSAFIRQIGTMDLGQTKALSFDMFGGFQFFVVAGQFMQPQPSAPPKRLSSLFGMTSTGIGKFAFYSDPQQTSKTNFRAVSAFQYTDASSVQQNQMNFCGRSQDASNQQFILFGSTNLDSNFELVNPLNFFKIVNPAACTQITTVTDKIFIALLVIQSDANSKTASSFLKVTRLDSTNVQCQNIKLPKVANTNLNGNMIRVLPQNQAIFIFGDTESFSSQSFSKSVGFISNNPTEFLNCITTQLEPAFNQSFIPNPNTFNIVNTISTQTDLQIQSTIITFTSFATFDMINLESTNYFQNTFCTTSKTALTVSPPTVTTTYDYLTTSGQPLSITIPGFTLNQVCFNPTYTYTFYVNGATGSIPTGISWDDATQKIQVLQTTQSGSYTMKVKATANSFVSGETSTIQVNVNTFNQGAPEFDTNPPSVFVKVLESITVTLPTITDPDGDSAHLMILNPRSFVQLIDKTIKFSPKALDTGMYFFQLMLYDNNIYGTKNTTYSLQVTVLPTTSIFATQTVYSDAEILISKQDPTQQNPQTGGNTGQQPGQNSPPGSGSNGTNSPPGSGSNGTNSPPGSGQNGTNNQGPNNQQPGQGQQPGNQQDPGKQGQGGDNQVPGQTKNGQNQPRDQARVNGQTVKKVETEAKTTSVSVIISDISIKGVASLRFSQTMAVPENYTQFNSSQLNVQYYNSEEANVTLSEWHIIKFDGQFMQMQLKFSDPSLVSTSSSKDKLIVTFVENGQFRTESGFVPVNYLYKVGSEIPAQLPNTKETQMLQSFADVAQSSVASIVVSSFALQIFLKLSLKRVWSMINILQLIIHIQGLDILFPANAQIFLLTLKDVTSFKILNTSAWLASLKLNALSANKQIASNLSNAGYASFSFLENLGVLFLALAAICAVMLLLLIFKLISKRFPVFDKVYKRIYKKLFFNGISRYLLQSYLVMACTAFIGLQALAFQSSADNVNSSFGIVTMCFIPIYPIFILFFLLKNRAKLKKKPFKLKFQTMYHAVDIKKKNNYVILVCPLFLLRRLTFALTMVFLQGYPFLQIGINMYFSLLYFMYLIKFRPMNKNYLNNLELVNESTLLCCYCLCFTFTDYVPLSTTRYQIGWCFIVLTSTNLAVGLGALLQKLYTSLKKQFKELKKWLKEKCGKKKVKDEKTELNELEGKKKSVDNVMDDGLDHELKTVKIHPDEYDLLKINRKSQLSESDQTAATMNKDNKLSLKQMNKFPYNLLQNQNSNFTLNTQPAIKDDFVNQGTTADTKNLYFGNGGNDFNQDNFNNQINRSDTSLIVSEREPLNKQIATIQQLQEDIYQLFNNEELSPNKQQEFPDSLAYDLPSQSNYQSGTNLIKQNYNSNASNKRYQSSQSKKLKKQEDLNVTLQNDMFIKNDQDDDSRASIESNTIINSILKSQKGFKEIFSNNNNINDPSSSLNDYYNSKSSQNNNNEVTKTGRIHIENKFDHIIDRPSTNADAIKSRLKIGHYVGPTDYSVSTKKYI